MRFDIDYRTTFTYDDVVRDSHNELRACPRSDERQQVIAYRLTTHPASRIASSTDYFGTRVDAFGIREPHVALEIKAEATVETSDAAMVTASPRLDAARESSFRDEHLEYLEPTRHTDPGAGVAACREAVAALAGDDLVSTVLAAHRQVHQRLEYRPGATEIGVDVESVLADGAGVCQDYAHAAVAVCRSFGIPARYVSGYFFSRDESTGEDVDGDVVSVQTHAWFEAAIPGHGWLALDPTNALSVGHRHVKIGHGRDYDDVAPVRGVYRGLGQATVTAGVEMRRNQFAPHQQQHQQQQ